MIPQTAWPVTWVSSLIHLEQCSRVPVLIVPRESFPKKWALLSVKNVRWANIQTVMGKFQTQLAKIAVGVNIWMKRGRPAVWIARRESIKQIRGIPSVWIVRRESIKQSTVQKNASSARQENIPRFWLPEIRALV